MRSGMVPIAVLLVPVVAAFFLGSVYGPAVQALVPGNEIMTASDQAFQTDTFSLSGSIGSLIPTQQENSPRIVTGLWLLDVSSGNVTEFDANLQLIDANGTGYSTINLSNMTSDHVILYPNGTAVITGVLGVTVNGSAASHPNATLTIVKLRAIMIELDDETFGGHPVYGIAQASETETAASVMAQESGLGLNNITQKMRLPQLPNPFH